MKTIRIAFASSNALWAFGICVVLTAFLIGVAVTTKEVNAQQCNRQARAIKDTVIWSVPPQFVTGRGWVNGTSMGMLPKGIPVYICQEMTVGFGFATQLWYQIVYWNNGWLPAWVLAFDLQASLSDPERRLSLISQALAETNPGTSPPNQRNAENPPPGTKPPSDQPSDKAQATVSKSLSFQLYGFSFLAMVLGMIAKAIVDILSFWEAGIMRENLRKAAISIFISPIVYSGLLQTIQISVNPAAFITLLVLAFQNGFFWQTILSVRVMEVRRIENSKAAH